MKFAGRNYLFRYILGNISLVASSRNSIKTPADCLYCSLEKTRNLYKGLLQRDDGFPEKFNFTYIKSGDNVPKDLVIDV